MVALMKELVVDVGCEGKRNLQLGERKGSWQRRERFLQWLLLM